MSVTSRSITSSSSTTRSRMLRPSPRATAPPTATGASSTPGSRPTSCPNGCSQHHIATIGFYGASIKVGEHTIPAYIPHIAGNFEGGDVVFGHRLKARLPAKRVPEAVERWIRHYEENRNDGEDFNAFVERTGFDQFEELISDLKLPVEFSADNLLFFIDWNRS